MTLNATSSIHPASPYIVPKGRKFGGVRSVLQSTMVASVVSQGALPLTSFVYQAFRDRQYIKRTKDQIFRVLKENDLRESSFDDVVGHELIKKNLQGWAQRIAEKQENAHYGMLLVGEPGTGKTLLTRSFAKNILGNATLLKVNCEALVENPATIVFLEEKINKLQKKNKPLVLLMDEIGTVGSRIETSNANGFSMIVRLLKIMDGLGNKVSIIATANSPERLDPAIRNRFPEIAEVHAPTMEESVQQLKGYLKKSSLSPDESVDLIQAAEQMEGLTGRRIEYIAQSLRNALQNEQMRTRQDLTMKNKRNRHPAKGFSPFVEFLFNQQQLLDAISTTKNFNLEHSLS